MVEHPVIMVMEIMDYLIQGEVVVVLKVVLVELVEMVAMVVQV